MSAKAIDCIYCHRSLSHKQHVDEDHPYVCDLCMECIRTHAPLPSSTAGVTPPPQSGGRKSSKRKGRKIKAVATALVFLLLPFVGCAVNWTGRVELQLDPAPLLTLQRPLPAPAADAGIPPLTEP